MHVLQHMEVYTHYMYDNVTHTHTHTREDCQWWMMDDISGNCWLNNWCVYNKLKIYPSMYIDVTLMDRSYLLVE